MVAELLPHITAVSHRDLQGDTAAHLAARRGYGAIVGSLQEAGADLSVRNEQNESVLDTTPVPRCYPWMNQSGITAATAVVNSASVMVLQDASLETLV